MKPSTGGLQRTGYEQGSTVGRFDVVVLWFATPSAPPMQAKLKKQQWPWTLAKVRHHPAVIFGAL